MTLALRLSLQGDVAEMVGAIVQQLPQFAGRPSKGFIRSGDLPSLSLDGWQGTFAERGLASYEWEGPEVDNPNSLSRDILRPDVIEVGCLVDMQDADLERLLALLPYSVATIGSVRAEYKLPLSHFISHFELGWGCAFRGDGHEQVLQSRRVLEQGEREGIWKYSHRDGDLSILQVHSLMDERAVVEARVRAASAMLFWPTGVQRDIEPEPVKGLYSRETKTFEIVVAPDANVTTQVMGSARELVEPDAAKDPIERVAFVFFSEAEARAKLRDLWLRGLECWYVDGAGRHRLDDTYGPQ